MWCSPDAHAHVHVQVLDELADGVEGEGKLIYAQKPNLGQNGVTWSQADYGHRARSGT